jgi:hypothetical protein
MAEAQSTPVGGEAPEALTCPECGQTIAPRGKMTPALALGLHRKAEHGVAGRPRNAKRNKARAAEADPEPVTPPPALTLLKTAGAEAGRGKSAPNADSLAKGMGRLYGYVGYFAWSLMVDADPRLATESEREEAAMALAPSPAEAIATVRPFARLAAATSVNKRYGASFIENLDVADALVAIGDQVRRARLYLNGRGSPSVPSMASPPPVGADGVPPNPMAGGYMGPTQGVVVDANMVAARHGRPPVPEPDA